MKSLLLASAAVPLLGAGLACGRTAEAGRPRPAERAAVVSATPPQQPFHFDHRIHAGKYEIPCQTCHVYADHSTVAGLPTLDKCIGCHHFVDKDKPEVQALTKAFDDATPVAWNRVHRLPDHVFFTHERHIQAGVSCSRCHGAVEQMEVVHQVAPLTMGWCVQCHKDNHAPATDCLTCHK